MLGPSPLLDRSVKQLSWEEIQAISDRPSEDRTTPSSGLTAESILSGFKKRWDGAVEITLPVGSSMEEVINVLNSAAKEKGLTLGSSLISEKDNDFWSINERYPELRTNFGQTYCFTIAKDTWSGTRQRHEHEFGESVPLGAIVIAEACERLNTDNKGTLFSTNASSRRPMVRGLTGGLAVSSTKYSGIGLTSIDDDSYNGEFPPPADYIREAGHIHRLPTPLTYAVSASSETTQTKGGSDSEGLKGLNGFLTRLFNR